MLRVAKGFVNRNCVIVLDHVNERLDCSRVRYLVLLTITTIPLYGSISSVVVVDSIWCGDAIVNFSTREGSRGYNNTVYPFFSRFSVSDPIRKGLALPDSQPKNYTIMLAPTMQIWEFMPSPVVCFLFPCFFLEFPLPADEVNQRASLLILPTSKIPP